MKNRDLYRIYEIPIKTVEQAKEYFREMGCPHFHMGRETPDRYREYNSLNISKKIEREWRKERFYEYYSSIMENTYNDSLWNIHARMYDLYENLETHEELMKILEVTKYIRDKVPIGDRVIVAETINGRTVRKARTGLIYKAYDSTNIAAAKEFAELSLHFSDCTDARIRNKERCQKSADLCKDIMRELGLY